MFGLPSKVVGRFLDFFFNDTATTEIYPLSLHDALPISCHSDPTSRWTETRLDLAATCLRLARCSTSARAARWPCSNGLYGVLTAAQRDRSRSFMRVDLHICAPVAMNRFARVSGMSFVSGLRLG